MNEIIDLGVENKNGTPVVNSRRVAEIFNKNHQHVLEAIKKCECSQEFSLSNFRPSEYRDSRGKRQPEFLLTKDGFAFIALGFTGKKAAQFKEAYIRRFNEMENELKVIVIGKAIRRELTDALRDSGLNDKMHGWGYKTFTDLIYKLVLGVSAKQYREMFGLPKDADIRNYLNGYQKQEITRLENAAQGMVNIGMDYEEVKRVLSEKFLDKPKLLAVN